jgi:hypothetical protein
MTEFGVISGRVVREGPDPALARARLVAECRRLGFVEYPRDLLRRRGGYYVDVVGELLLPVRDAVLHGHAGLPDGAEHVFGFFLSEDGMPVFLKKPRSRPWTLEQLEADEQAREHAAARRAEAEAEEHRAFLQEQPRHVLTAADLEPDRPIPTLREAAETIADAGGTLEPTEHGFAVTVPERFAASDGDDLTARQRVREAARVLDAARELVHARLAEGRSLPDLAPPVGGGGAVTT